MKKFLVSLLLICGVALPCFSNADNVEDLIIKVCPSSNPNCSYFFTSQSIDSTYRVIYTFNGDNTNVDIRGHTLCIKFSNWSTQSTSDVFLGFASNTNQTKPYNTIEFDQNKLDYQCIYVNNNYSYMKVGVGAGTTPITVNMELFLLDDLLATALPKLTSLECQTEYNLIPISSVDQSYCVNNNLCPSVDCPEYPDNPNIGTSNLYINDVFHPGAFNVIVNIPEEIDWDYAYTNSGSNFNLDIVGYNQDFELIEDWIATNNYKPTSDDFTNIFTSGFSKLGGLLVALLFVILVFYLVKKLF